ncbi:MAG: hypothetical protein RIQ73_530, partial [Actinomycetota bacterium]
MSSTLASAPVKLNAATSANVIALAYVSDGADSFVFQGPGTIIEDIQQCFEVNLLDELSFFSPTGKPGEIFEIPVSAQDCVTDRIYLTAVGDATTPAFRIAATAIARKVRGKNSTVYSACAVNKTDIAAHAISLTMGAYLWSLKSGKPADVPTFSVASDDKEIVNAAHVYAKAVARARDMVHTPSNIKTPAWMATQAQAFAKSNGLKVSVLSGKALKDFGGLRAVGNSSPDPGPRLIEVSYAPKNRKNSVAALPHIVLVGKGITFDTGGVSLK